MLTAMRNAPLRRLVIALASVLVILAAGGAGIGLYVAALAWWPFLPVWWPRLLAGAGAIGALGAWWLWWRLPKRQINRLRLTIRDPKARADVEDNLRKTIGQPFAATAVLIGAVVAYLQFTQQQQTSRDLLISNQVSKGFEQLGSDKLVVRLGGIYALEGVMNTSEQYHQPVLEALCAFVRDGTRTNTGEGPPATDIQAALTVIGRRKVIGTEIRDTGKAPNLSKAHISKANLYRANLSLFNLSDANLSGAKLARANLSGAMLDNANLSDTGLTGADLSAAFLYGANLSGAIWGGANLSGATLTGANLTNPVYRVDQCWRAF